MMLLCLVRGNILYAVLSVNDLVLKNKIKIKQRMELYAMILYIVVYIGKTCNQEELNICQRQQ